MATSVKTDSRTYNPLSDLSSYTYNLTLYMVTPETMNAYIETSTLIQDEKNLKYIIVAQGGGITNDSQPRGLTYDGGIGPGKEGMDFYIDELVLTQYMPQSNKMPTTGSTIKWKITEAYGFTFLNRLSNASLEINKFSSIISQAQRAQPTLYQQNYIIGVRFYGYNPDGSIEQPAGNKALYERFFPIQMKSLTFRLTGRATEYHCEAVILPEQVALGVKFALLNSQIEISGNTVEELLSDIKPTGLMAQLNAQQSALADQKKIGKGKENTFKIKWLATGDNIKTSNVVIQNLKKLSNAPVNTPMTGATTTTQVNPRISTSGSANTINNADRKIAYQQGRSIISILDEVISNSEYIIKKIYQLNAGQLAVAVQNSRENVTLNWYSISQSVEIKGRDEVTNDWFYNITYVVSEFEMPFIRTLLKTTQSVYYGAFKKYYYWLTGKNTEVISYEQTYNNLFYMVLPNSTTTVPDLSVDAKKELENSGVPVHYGPGGAGPSPDIRGAGSYVNNLRASVYSIADQAQASIKILGDPDYLMQIVGVNRSANFTDNFVKRYAKDLTFNPYDGQLLIEIIFNMGEDYVTEPQTSSERPGLVNVSDQFQLVVFGTPEENKLLKNEGIIYNVKDVESTFNRGVFTQTLNLIIVPPATLIRTNTPSQDDTTRADPDPRDDPRKGRGYNANFNAVQPAAIQGTVGTTNSGNQVNFSDPLRYWKQEAAREEGLLARRYPDRGRKPITDTTGIPTTPVIPGGTP